MATAEGVKSKIQGLISAANETTGEAASDLTTAIATLISGFGKGSGGTEGGSTDGDSGGGNVNVKLFSGNIKNGPTAVGSRISVDFGFDPDFILFIAQGTVSGSIAVARWGFSAAAAEALSPTIKGSYNYVVSSGIKSSLTGGTIDGSATNQPIYNADATGFNIGWTPNFNGTYYCIAMKLT